MNDDYIIKFINNFVEVENVAELKNNDFVYVLEKNNNNKKDYYCDTWKKIFSKFKKKLENKTIINNSKIVDLYEKKNSCKLFFFKSK